MENSGSHMGKTVRTVRVSRVRKKDRRRAWSADELAVLRTHYGLDSARQLGKRLPRRSWRAICQAARRLGLHGKAGRPPARSAAARRSWVGQTVPGMRSVAAQRAERPGDAIRTRVTRKRLDREDAAHWSHRTGISG